MWGTSPHGREEDRAKERRKLQMNINLIRYTTNVGVMISQQLIRLLFGVNEKLLTQHISGPITKYRLLYVSNQGRAGARAWTRVRARAKG